MSVKLNENKLKLSELLIKNQSSLTPLITDAVSVPGWTGAGYIITDPVTGMGLIRLREGELGYLNFS